MVKTPLVAILSLCSDTSIQMDEKVIIDCIGPAVLTITMGGATHSVAIATDVIRISGRGDYGLDSLPLIYDATVLGGRLTICDGAGKMIYCWRSVAMMQSKPDPSVSTQGRTEHSLSSPLESALRREMIESDLNLASSSSDRLETLSNRLEKTPAPLCTNNLTRMSSGMSPSWGSIPCSC